MAPTVPTGNSPRTLSTSVFCIAFVIFLSIAASSARPLKTDRWRHPCGTGSTATRELRDIMATMKAGASQVRHSAANLKNFLTEGLNPRVSDHELTTLSTAHVGGFPYDFVSDPKDNITDVAIVDYVFLSKLYIFLYQSMINQEACDTRADKAVGKDMISSVLNKTLETLCGVNTFLEASGTAMPVEQIPDSSDVLKNSNPSMQGLADCENDSTNLRNKVDYVLARDTETTSSQLHVQYANLLNRLS